MGAAWVALRRRDPARHRAAFDALFGWCRVGRLNPHVSHCFPLEHAAEALETLAGRTTTGKVVLTTGGR